MKQVMHVAPHGCGARASQVFPERRVTDPIASIGHAGAAMHATRALAADAAAPASGAVAAQAMPPSEALLARVQAGLEEARALGAEAERAAAMVRSGESSDVEGVLLATRKADAAFQMLQAVRNAMLEAYAQVRDIRA